MASLRPYQKKRYCPVSHDTDIVGRTSSGRCRECCRDYHKTESYRLRRKEREQTVEYRTKRVFRDSKYRATVKYFRSEVRSKMQKLRKRHSLSDQSLELIFTEVNEVLAG